VAATFASQLQDLDRHCPDASKLLRVIAFFDPESIPLEMLITGAKAIVDAQQSRTRSPLTKSLLALIQSPLARQNGITHLQARCLVTYHAGSQSPTFCIHDLIQLVILENTRSSGLNQELFEIAVELACTAFRQIKNVESHEWWPRCELLVPHIQLLTLRQDTSSKVKNTLLLANHNRGMYLSSRGRYVEAENLCENIIADREQLFSADDLDTLAVMDHLAWVYQCRGRYGDAETLFERVLEGYKTRLGPEDRYTLNTMYNLARVYYHQHRNDDAETLLKQTIQSQESQFGPEDVDTLWTMNWLAEVYRSQQRYDEAYSLLTGVLQAREKLLGSEHIDTLYAEHTIANLYAKHILANLYISRRQYDAAAALLQQVLRVWETNLGLQHPATLTAMYALAYVYTSQGRYRDAENLLVRVLAARERIFGLSHPHTRQTVMELARVYGELGQLDDAKMLKQRISPSSSCLSCFLFSSHQCCNIVSAGVPANYSHNSRFQFTLNHIQHSTSTNRYSPLDHGYPFTSLLHFPRCHDGGRTVQCDSSFCFTRS
jgi:tetratricopeptide (TPR) repeat protein